MQPDVGKIYEGKVTGITKFGAFVEIEPGVTGMVHISEVANTFVNEIKDHLTEGQQVKVKVLSVSEEGKISLSIKKALPAPPKKEFRGPREGGGRPNGNTGKPNGAAGKPRQDRVVPKEPQTPESAFEDMLNKFKASSDERIGDIRKNMDNKRRNTSRRRGG
ncbi:MAG: S1 RNA-binding domain-containing protein [Oscillospiraceae bacterium]|nr:S1 RNA-binding domain-containing protein [Oscillospiraceae bacterium]